MARLSVGSAATGVAVVGQAAPNAQEGPSPGREDRQNRMGDEEATPPADLEMLDAADDEEILNGIGFIDTHCHLEEVLQLVKRHTTVPSLNKNYWELDEKEKALWCKVGWVLDSAGNKLRGPPPPPGSASASDAASDKDGEGSPESSCWGKDWSELSEKERRGAEGLGYEATSWNTNKWLLPKGTAWEKLNDDLRRHLQELGESSETWDAWAADSGVEPSAGTLPTIEVNDMRTWFVLSDSEKEAAKELGFSEATWNCEELADLGETIDKVFGSHMLSCVTQGCDEDSIETAAVLAKSHPKVYASFGCHPKAAWSYNDALEQQLLSLARSCGSKTVAWGEFGLDYSHPSYGRNAENRRGQKTAFARQLQLAVRHGYPLVIHSRAADRDTMRMLREFVPRDWKVHIHSYRGGVQMMKMILNEFENTYIGIPGIVTMADPHAHELCRHCPLSRMVLETDAPYLPVNGQFYSHPGLLPTLIRSVAKIKGLEARDVARAVRENAHAVYGI